MHAKHLKRAVTLNPPAPIVSKRIALTDAPTMPRPRAEQVDAD